MLDIAACLTAARQHQQRMSEHPAPVMNRGPLPEPGHRRRQRTGQPDTVRETPQSEQPRAPHHPLAAACRTRVRDTAKFHLGDAPLNSLMRPEDTRIIAGQRSLSANPHTPNPPTHEKSGLVVCRSFLPGIMQLADL